MYKKDNDDVYVLSTGREFYANNGIIGTEPDMGVGTGYDDMLDIEISGWTKEEKAELADFMIALWTRFKTGQEAGR